MAVSHLALPIAALTRSGSELSSSASPTPRSGVVVEWTGTGGFGFIQPRAGGSRVFVDCSETRDGDTLSVGEQVTYHMDTNRRTSVPCAKHVSRPTSVPQFKAPDAPTGSQQARKTRRRRHSRDAIQPPVRKRISRDALHPPDPSQDKIDHLGLPAAPPSIARTASELIAAVEAIDAYPTRKHRMESQLSEVSILDAGIPKPEESKDDPAQPVAGAEILDYVRSAKAYWDNSVEAILDATGPLGQNVDALLWAYGVLYGLYDLGCTLKPTS